MSTTIHRLTPSTPSEVLEVQRAATQVALLDELEARAGRRRTRPSTPSETRNVASDDDERDPSGRRRRARPRHSSEHEDPGERQEHRDA